MMIYFILRLLALLPLRINHILGAFLGYCFFVCQTKVKKISQKNIALSLIDLNKNQQEKLLKRTLIELGKTIVEVANIWFSPIWKTNAKIKVVNGHLLDKKQALIILTPHLGCWEVVGNYLATQHKTTILYKPLRRKKSNDLLVKTRQNCGYQLAPADKTGVIKLQRALLNKEWIGILPDQKPAKKNGVWANFFDHPALTMTLLTKLARKKNTRVVSVWAERLSGGKGYCIHCNAVSVLTSKDDLLADCSKMNAVIEAMIKENPAQYQWNYQRFKSSQR